MARFVGVRNSSGARVARRRPPVDARITVSPGARAQSNHCRRVARIGSHRRAEGRCVQGAASPDRARLGCRGVSRHRGTARVLASGLGMNPDKYCRDRVAQSGSSFYYSFLFLSPERRSAITALYAFCREVDDVVDNLTDPDIARAKLAWWRQEISLAFAGTAQHPVARALQAVVRRYALPEAHFQTVIDGMAMDLEQNRYLDFSALEQYCHRVAGVVGLMSAEIFGYDHPDTRVYARDLGIAFQLTNILRDVGEDARRGRIYLPQDDLARFGVAPSSLPLAPSSDAGASPKGARATGAQ